jgi:hypothetical protein
MSGVRQVGNVLSSSKLGEYLVIKDIAEGTFGKVKSKHSHRRHSKARINTVYSGYPCPHRPAGGDEVSLQASHT